MDNPLQLKNNLVCLTGKVLSEPSYSHHVFGEGFYEAYLVISRLSEQSDIIPITISERLMKDVPLKTDKIVSIEGQFRSYNKIIDDRSKLMLTVFVRDIAEYDESINFIKNPNQINLIGYVCKNPIFRTTPFNREICDILIAVNRAFNKSDYIPCIAWGRNARFAASLSIGTKLSVSGRIQSREYQKQIGDGQIDTRIAYELSVSRMTTVSEDENTKRNNFQRGNYINSKNLEDPMQSQNDFRNDDIAYFKEELNELRNTSFNQNISNETQEKMILNKSTINLSDIACATDEESDS